MRNGWIKCAAVTPLIKVADCGFNAVNIIDGARKAAKSGARVIVFPELCITGYTCGDLFYQETLLEGATGALFKIADKTSSCNAVIFVGLPLRKEGRIYNVAAVLCKGEILGFVPKSYLPNYNEFYEKRQFCSAPDRCGEVVIGGKAYPFGKDLLFCDVNVPELCIGAELCEDMWSVVPPGVEHALAGATVLVNLSASDETVGKAEYRRQLISSYSARLVCGLVYADAGRGESSTDMVFAGHNIIAENGKLLSQTELFENGSAVGEIDVKFLAHERSRLFNYDFKCREHERIYFDLPTAETSLTRKYERLPFVPSEDAERSDRAKLILRMQAEGLAKRLQHTKAKTMVIGVSGGLDSCLSLLVAVRARKLIDYDCRIIGVTMPCFGTTGRTYNNACNLVRELGAELREINIKETVKRHFEDIGHGGNPDVTFENSQARERTQIIMDIANMTGGLVVGTGDLSELALGWTTYNGDHMSMYGVNASVPKTLVRHLVKYEADNAAGILQKALYDILDTPVSPELLPTDGEDMSQKTEDIIGPYELHDFFLYYMVRCGFAPSKARRIALLTFKDIYSEETVDKWLDNFVNRFFSQQFKRSCLPDGVKIGSVTLSPRGDWRMPSDASSSLWKDRK